MNWLGRILGHAALDAAAAERLQRWRSLPRPELGASFNSLRWVVVDVEATGLDISSDRLVSIGAVAVEGGGIRLSDTFDVVLQEDAGDGGHDDAVLVHGLGPAARRAGVPPAEALLRFLEYVRHDPLVAYHAPFDAAMLERAMRQHLGIRFRPRWLDLAELAPLVVRDAPPRSGGLDAWLEKWGIANPLRHNAASDALATAQLFLALAPYASRGGASSGMDLLDTAKQSKWIKQIR